MGNAQYQRGSALVRAQTDTAQRPSLFQDIDDLNALPKDTDARTPWGTVVVYHAHEIWTIECPQTGFGYWYPSLRALLRRWRIQLTSYDATTGRWAALPMPADNAPQT